MKRFALISPLPPAGEAGVRVIVRPRRFADCRPDLRCRRFGQNQEVTAMRKTEAERNRERIEEGQREVLKHFAYLDKELKGREFFADRLSLADISFVPHLSSYERAGYAVGGDFPNLKAWWERMKSRPSYE